MKNFAMNRWIASAFPLLLALSASAQTKGVPAAKPSPTPAKGAAAAKPGATPSKPAATPPKTTAPPAKGTPPARPPRTPTKTAPQTSPVPKATPTPEKEVAIDPKKAAADAQAALLKADTDWAAAATLGKDMERIVSYWAEDAVIFPPGENPVSGKGAARKHMTGKFKTPWFSISWKPERAVVSASGDMGYTSGTSDLSATDANGKVVMSQGRYLATWKRVGDGPWLCTTHVWNEGPSKAPAKKK